MGSSDLTLEAWLRKFSAALQLRDFAALAELFLEQCFWRDFVAFTWDLRTFEGQTDVFAMLEATLDGIKPDNWAVAGAPVSPSEGWITFETALGRGEGYVRLLHGRCWTLLTALKELKGYEEPLGLRRPLGAEYGVRADADSWLDRSKAAHDRLGRSEQPYVLIVGGGQAGLALGARLRMLNVPTLIVDRHAHAGDQWRRRYKSLSLHDPVWYDHLPYLPFPDSWPVFTPKDKMADWLEAYSKLMELDIWNGAECVAAGYDDDADAWRVTIKHDGESVLLCPKQLVIATGNAGKARVPQCPGAESFAGTQYHSSFHPGGDGCRGKRVVVIGSNNSAHDICADLWQYGADVTMIQRSSTHVSRSATMMELMMAPLYSEQAVAAGVSTEKADLLMASVPLRVLPDVQRPLYQEMARRDADFYRRLQDAGFVHDFGEDGSGLYLKYLRRAAGYYIDVGASELIADGRIKLRSRVGVAGIEPAGVVLSDGSLVAADVIIYATGFGSMDEWIADIVSTEISAKIGKVWGYGSGTTGDPGPWEGELRNMWKPTKQRGLWFHGGNLAQSRHYSLYLALQLKARKEHLPIAQYPSADGDPQASVGHSV